MNRVKILKILNPLLGLVFLIQVFTIICLKFEIPINSILQLHEMNAYAFITIILLHIIFNWNWIQTHYFKAKKKSPPVKG